MTTPAVLARRLQRRRPDGPPTPGGDPHVDADRSARLDRRRAKRRSEYRSFLTFDADDGSLPLVLQQATSWLREKGFDEALEESALYESNSKALTVVHRESSRCHDVRIRLAEQTRTGRWESALTVHLPDSGQGWLTLSVANDQGIESAPPRLASRLLDVLEARDGDLVMSSTPVLAREEVVDDLLDQICAEDRHGLVFVAATAEEDPIRGRTVADFRERATRWARDVTGLAQVVVLDPRATAEFNAAMGDSHGIPLWSIRTYAPEPDPAWAADAPRHRIFSAARLHTTRDADVARTLGHSARGHALSRPLPASVASVDRYLSRALDRLVLDRIFDPEARRRVDLVTAPKIVDGGPEVDAPDAVTAAVESTPMAPELEPEPAQDGSGVALTAPTAPNPAGSPGTRVVDRPSTSDVPGSPETTAVGADRERHKDAGSAAGVAAAAGLLDVLRELFDIEEVTEQSLRELRRDYHEARVRAAHAQEVAELAREELDQRRQQQEELEDEGDFLREYATAADELRDDADLRARRAADEARWLRKQLESSGQYDVAYGIVPQEAFTSYPESFADLLDRFADLEPAGVLFTGDADVVRGLDDHDASGRLVRATWECALALAGYVEAKREEKVASGVFGYLTDPPSGYAVVSRNRFAPKESTSTMNKFGAERIFPVPETVCAGGTATMEAHFKVGTLGMVSPRMHFHDATAEDGCVYVGYIGPHLRTEATN
ncbi:hypothetical protein JK386_04910 [Nocardioides sp. zg-536]|uniref:Uncharacterized protein n=1 Tax=Nocardioides faecalis TaxID=2803858 RepID=A0A938Y6P9_9ACTN|nr:hypothetical protein [Nocardioides faecalis]MBM9459233.1 hypothetical protein [Nocardioides faecalis]QVI59632.1 hypothetical protein KG111_04605 [Nocardioides faecalis]